MKRSEAFPSKYISKDDLQSPVRATIKEIVKEKMPGDEGEQETVLFFSEEIKPFICNITNWMILEEAFGDESNDWIGKQVEMFWDPSVMFGTKRTGGRRVRKPNGNGHGLTNRDAKIEELKGIRAKIRELKADALPAKPAAEELAGDGLDKVLSTHADLLESLKLEMM